MKPDLSHPPAGSGAAGGPDSGPPAAAPRTALVTGATAGIGAAFARRLAAESYRLLLVARDEQRLAAQARTLSAQGGQVEVLPADLATPAGLATVAERLTRHPVELLINNAGISLNRSFLDSDPAGEERLLRLNVLAVMQLTHAALPGMVRQGRGGIINVSSIAGFLVSRGGSTYSASKAWVTNFSESVAHAARPHGVRVLALCPGLVRTEFHERAGIDLSRTPRGLWLDADRVAAEGLHALWRGKIVRVVDWRYRMLLVGIRCSPRRLVRAIARGGTASGR